MENPEQEFLLIWWHQKAFIDCVAAYGTAFSMFQPCELNNDLGLEPTETKKT